MSASTPTAIILAAGRGERIREVVTDRPKPLIEFDGCTLVERSIAVLQRQGIDRILMVVGHRAADFEALGALPGVELVFNPDYATHGSLGSLIAGLERVEHGDALCVEGDLVYEERAITRLLASPHPDVILASGLTRAGDEVWVGTRDERVASLGKHVSREEVVDEFVGITRLSRSLCAALPQIQERTVRAHGPEVEYDTHGLALAASEREIRVERVTDLVWGEIDDGAHYRRVRDHVWPACVKRDGIPRTRALGSGH
jgi:2-aminoethylphosphonate-pyruvate transaminase